uniref:Uncharacterized protein n=1 Tax=Ditylenchus dipsaci TaxID=166011 RepID=A0A915EB20_9BILA
MAKVIRRQWVYRKNNRVWRTLPRRHDGRMTFDYEAPENALVNFENPMPGDPPKLWVAWVHRDVSKMSQKFVTN